MTFVGPVVLDVCQHFVERWNEIKKRKVRVILMYHLISVLIGYMDYSIAMRGELDWLNVPGTWSLVCSCCLQEVAVVGVPA